MTTANLIITATLNGKEIYREAQSQCVSTKWIDGEEEISFKDNSFLNFDECHIYTGQGTYEKVADWSTLDLY